MKDNARNDNEDVIKEGGGGGGGEIDKEVESGNDNMRKSGESG